MGTQFPEIPDELLPRVGDAVKGWKHMTDAVSTDLPTNLMRANRVRRGALMFLTVPKRPRKGK